METYRSTVAGYLHTGRRSDANIARLDEQAIGHLVKHLNDRHPGMNLMLAADMRRTSPAAPFTVSTDHRRVIFNHYGSEPLQHFLVDIQIRPNRPASIVVIEPTSLYDHDICSSLQKFRTAIRARSNFANAQLTLIGADLQRNPYDNLLFTLAVAKYSHEHRADISAWHEAQHRGKAIEAPGNDPLAALPPGVSRNEIQLWRSRYAKVGYRLCSAVQLAPAFIQHAQDAYVLMAHLLAVPETDEAGRALLEKKLGDLHINRGEPLSIERWRAELIEDAWPGPAQPHAAPDHLA
jgi:hypothetical protein